MGATGLPASAIQINPGFTPPSEIPVTKAGEGTTNYPALSSNFTGVYTFTNGLARGFRLGGTANVAWFNRRYYYYPNGIGPTAERRLFSFPTQARFDLLLGYTGLLSFGHAAFMGSAAYATGWLTTTQATSPWIGLLFALALTGGSALLIGALTLRLNGHFLPLSTIAFAKVPPHLQNYLALKDFEEDRKSVV